MKYEVRDRVARITLGRSELCNGITWALPGELERCVEQADLDPSVHVLLLAGAVRGFCGGYDLVESAEGRGTLGAEGPAPPRRSGAFPRVVLEERQE
jgi:enoyl-CoA hydratase